MRRVFSINTLWCTRLLTVWLLTLSPLLAQAQGDNPAAALRSKYTTLIDKLGNNQFKRPLYLDSVESSSNLKGDIYALVDYPYDTVHTALNNSAHWCDVLILHLNTKYCRAVTAQDGTLLKVSIGKKFDQPLDDAYPFEFAYRAVASTSDYFQVQLAAAKGPLGTSNYKIQLEALKLDSGRTFLHLMYSYDYGMAGEFAMKIYLATAGSDKVGFTTTAKRLNGQPEYIRGMRGVVERNAMRYYLAIEAYLSEFFMPPALQFEKRLESWYDATEQYSRQLHEVERTDYLEMKRKEYLRQQTVP
ncbi:MAG: hypothetical protein V4443_07835 [Pseudomonadota bacterium]